MFINPYAFSNGMSLSDSLPSFSKIVYPVPYSLTIATSAGDVIVGGDFSSPELKVDVWRENNGAWEIAEIIYQPDPDLFFGSQIWASSNYLAISGFSLSNVRRIHLYEKFSGTWVYMQSITDLQPFAIQSVTFNESGDFIALAGQSIFTFAKTAMGWSASASTQPLGAYLHPEMSLLSTGLIWAGSTLIVPFTRSEFGTGSSGSITWNGTSWDVGSTSTNYDTILPITWNGSSWYIGAGVSTTDGLERLNPLAATNGRMVFRHIQYVVPTGVETVEYVTEIVEYNIVGGSLVFGHTLSPPPFVEDPRGVPGQSKPFDPSGYGINSAAYIGNKLLIAATGFTGLIWGYNLGPSSSSLAYTTTVDDPNDKEGPGPFFSGGNYGVLAYAEGVYIPDEWGGWVEADSFGIYIIT